MTYEKVKNLKPEEFKRLCGVHPETFTQMTEDGLSRSKTKLKTGRPAKLSLEDQLLMTLEYWSGAGDAPPPENTAPIFILANLGESTSQQHIVLSEKLKMF